jgi:predicted N-acetyltransferase YhbS
VLYLAPVEPAIRDARDEEAGAVADLLSRAAFGPTVSRLVAFPRTSPHGDVLVADGAGEPLGAVCCVSFGRTGWIGALGVAPEVRRRGLGRALTEAAIARLHERGAETVLLFATDMGRPVYERLGFAIEGGATAWRGTAGTTPAAVQVRRLREEDRDALQTLDRAATGEDRANLLRALRPLTGLAAERGGAMTGWAARAPYGAGIAICGGDDEAGIALMAAAAGGPEPATIVVPDANVAAAAVLRRWGFRAASAGDRMRLGPAVAWRPERQFGLFNLFWG